MNWFDLKVQIAELSGISRDALHIHLGLVAMLLAAALLRTGIGSLLVWLLVLLLTLANEAYDLWYEQWPELDLQLQEGARDVWNTMLQPTLLLILTRVAPGLFSSGRRRVAAREDGPDAGPAGVEPEDAEKPVAPGGAGQ